MPRRNRVPFPARSKVTPLGQLAALGFGEHLPEPPSTVTSCVCKEEYPILSIDPRPPLPPDPELRKQCGNSGNNAKIFSRIFKIDFLRFLAAGHPQPRSRSEPIFVHFVHFASFRNPKIDYIAKTMRKQRKQCENILSDFQYRFSQISGRRPPHPSAAGRP